MRVYYDRDADINLIKDKKIVNIEVVRSGPVAISSLNRDEEV